MRIRNIILASVLGYCATKALSPLAIYKAELKLLKMNWGTPHPFGQAR